MHQGKRIYVRGVVIITWYGTSYPQEIGVGSLTKVRVWLRNPTDPFLHQNLEVSEKVLIFADRNKNDTYMNAVSMNNLWTYLQGLSLTASNRKWLAERLVESENKEVMSDQEIKEGLTEAFSKLDGLKQGNVKTRSAEELLYEL